MLYGTGHSPEVCGCREVVWFYPGQEVTFLEPFGNWLFSKSTCTWQGGRRVCRGVLQLPALGDQSGLERGGIPGLAHITVWCREREKGSGALGWVEKKRAREYGCSQELLEGLKLTGWRTQPSCWMSVLD